MLYLLDANSLITAHNTYYARHRVPEFWTWLAHHGADGRVKLPPLIYGEVEAGNDALAKWMSEKNTKDALKLKEEHHPQHVAGVLGFYGSTLTEAQLHKIGKDPFLVATALADRHNRVVVTGETHEAKKTGANRKVPNVCEDCGVAWMDPVRFINELDFTTDWDDFIG